jgi:Flp pilus assembly protein TadD
MRVKSNLVVALMFAAVGCASNQAKPGEVVVAHQETRSSGSAAPVAASDAADCEQKEHDPAMAEVKGLIEQKNYAAAAQKLEQMTAAQPDKGAAWMMYGYAVHASGDLDRALEIHQKAASFPEQRATALYNVACVHALKGDKTSAFAALDQSIEAGFHKAEYLEKDTDLDSLRADPRFASTISAAKEKAAMVGYSDEKAAKKHDCAAAKAARATSAAK